MEVLVVVAHPDDEVLGIGGTICKHVAEGDIVHLLIVTDGSSGQYGETGLLEEIIKKKEEETRKCAEILGISTVEYGDLPDMKLDALSHIKINKCIETCVQKYMPEIVYTHFFGDVNKDHQCVSESTLVATRPICGQTVKRVYYFRTPSSTEWNFQNVERSFVPNTFVDISKFMSKKIQAISCYETELREYPHPRSIRSIEVIDKAAGTICGTKAAELLMLAREVR